MGGEGWQVFGDDPAVEQLARSLARVVVREEVARPCQTYPLPSRMLSMRTLPNLRRWDLTVIVPERLTTLTHFYQLLVRLPEMVSCRIVWMTGSSVDLALLTVVFDEARLTHVIERCLQSSGGSPGFSLRAFGHEVGGHADLR
ncbi:hypothetical protein [Thermomicrobium sp.]